MRKFLFVLLLSVLVVIAYGAANHVGFTHHQVEPITTTRPQDMRARYDIEINVPPADRGETYLHPCIHPPEVMP